MTGVWRPPTGSKRVKDKQIVSNRQQKG